ncbi:MAG: Kdo domain containing protein [Flavobacteriaceae bacterium]|nr:Kdo domain containing protein [Flavobacteriaceae bacterium]
MKFSLNQAYTNQKEDIFSLVTNFDSLDDPNAFGSRNKIKAINLNDKPLCIKSFKRPNVINRIAYTFFRKSKAERSYTFAHRLLSLGIGTPEPIAFFEFKKYGLINKSFYISEQLDSDLTYRDLTKNFDYPDYENILRAFTRFTNELHNKGVLFLDHSPGNTLIKKVGNQYHFFLVDLNRMRFKQLSFEECINNYRKLTIHSSMVEIMSDELSKITNYDFDKINALMWASTEQFQKSYHRRRKLKKQLKFWRK